MLTDYIIVPIFVIYHVCTKCSSRVVIILTRVCMLLVGKSCVVRGTVLVDKVCYKTVVCRKCVIRQLCVEHVL